MAASVPWVKVSFLLAQAVGFWCSVPCGPAFLFQAYFFMFPFSYPNQRITLGAGLEVDEHCLLCGRERKKEGRMLE